MTTQTGMINSKQKRWLTGGLIFLLTFFMLYFLGQIFPYTGLAAIIMFPVILLTNAVIIIGTIFLTKNVRQLGYILCWTTTALFTIFITLALHPQEFRPNVFKQISYSITAIQQFDDSNIKDLDLPFSVDDFSRYECKIKDAQEKYVVALYKFRSTIPLDGSFHIYREEKTGVISYDYDTSIKSIEEIPEKFRTGQDKIIWWTLKRLGK